MGVGYLLRYPTIVTLPSYVYDCIMHLIREKTRSSNTTDSTFKKFKHGPPISINVPVQRGGIVGGAEAGASLEG